MAGAANQGVSVEIGGVEYRLKFTLNSLVVLEELTGKTVEQVMAELDAGQMSFTFVRTFIQAALYNHKRGITAEEAGDLASEYGDAIGLVVKASEALALAFPQPDQSESASAGNQPAPVGAAG